MPSVFISCVPSKTHVRVPVHLPHPPRRKRHQGRRDGRAPREVRRVDLVQRPASPGRLDRRLLQRAEHKRARPGRRLLPGPGRDAAVRIAPARRAVDDPGAGPRHAVEHARAHAKVLGQHVARRVRDPVVDVERRPRRVRVGAVKDQQELVLLAHPLDGVRHAPREVPDVAEPQRLGLVAAVLVDCRHQHAAVVHEPPLRRAVPVRLADGALREVLLRGGHVVARREVRDGLLARPAARRDARLGLREAPFQVGHDAVVGGLLAQVRRVLQVQLVVRASQDGAPSAGPVDRLARVELRSVSFR